MSGQVVQAGSISGGVHHHTTNVGSQHFTVNVGAPGHAANARSPKAAARQTWAGVVLHAKLAAALAPPFLLSLVVVSTVSFLTRGAHLGVQLFLVVTVLALVLALIAPWPVLRERGITGLLGAALDRTIPRFVKALPLHALVQFGVYVVAWTALWVFAIVREPSANSERPEAATSIFVFTFLVLFGAQTGRAIALRRRVG
ncbi:hypothetical protein GCM10017774_73410 [Lentzea cavernae]|uniref:Uncharacterized protein n=1 Tax=Lentzea cavernae TaxID=2020703 RepID=A0ABQ3MT54_9PSEU|nr:hypothetical protein GCM10017774_73410 [Lentzea cavernae]